MTRHDVVNGTQCDAKDIVKSRSLENSTVDPRRLRGVYYTPDAIAGLLAEWAIAAEPGTVLDPSFGGCAFMNAATRVLANRGISDPGRLVFGVDVEPSCLEYVRASTNLVETNCTIKDFLTLLPEDIHGAPFQAVIGNPPYVRHHWLKGTTREAGSTAIEATGVNLSGRASAWAYFLIHTMNFIATNGRLALLVPEAILQADYAAAVRDLLRNSFNHVCLVHIRDRLFEGTDEAVVAVAASEYGGNGGVLRVEAVECPEELKAVLDAPSSRKASLQLVTSKGRRVNSLTLEVLSELEQHPSVRLIDDFATVKVGLVTGANQHFIRNDNDMKQLGVPKEFWERLISRGRWLSGLEFTEEDLQRLADAGHHTILVRPLSTIEESPGIQQWIARGIEAGIHERYKCKLRRPWYRVDLQPAPDAFATCTRLGAPLLILNQAGCHCTNALHAMYWHRTINASPRAIIVGFLTSAVSVWSELHGRRYGGGVLKMEPGILNRTPVPVIEDSEGAFHELNKLIRYGREAEARAIADDLVLGDRLGLTKKDIRRLQRARTQLMVQRRPVRNGSDHA